MQLQFRKQSASYAHNIIHQICSQEETQDVKLPDSMPDVSEVLGAWGQILIRTKEWRNHQVEVSGGIMAKILYKAEGTDEPQCVESWVPFQLRTRSHTEEIDCAINVHCFLRFADARSVSARKIIFRAGISGVIDCYVKRDIHTYIPEELPEGVYIKEEKYPVIVAAECGEKTFSIDEEFLVPASVKTIEKIIRYTSRIEIVDKKVISEKVVFRGCCVCNVLFVSDDGTVNQWEFDHQFSQYSELNQEFEPDAPISIIPAITGLEMEMSEDGKLHLRAGILCQYVVYTGMYLHIVEDAYSIRNDLKAECEDVVIPSVLDSVQESIRIEQMLDCNATNVVDAVCYFDVEPAVRNVSDYEIRVNCQFQILYYDSEGMLKSFSVQGESTNNLSVDQDALVNGIVYQSGKPLMIKTGDSWMVSASCLADITVLGNSGLPMVTALEIGEPLKSDDSQPSLILRRVGSESIWDIAKHYGSDPDALKEANLLDGEPQSGTVIIIPVK